MKCFKYEAYKLFSNKLYLVLFVLYILSAVLFCQFQVEQNVNNDLYQQTVSQAEYDNYISDIQKTAVQQGSVSVFGGDADTFSSRNIQKTQKDIVKLKDINITENTGGSVKFITGIKYFDVLLILLSVFSVYLIFFSEKELGLYHLMKTTPNGNGKTYFSKLGLLFFVGFLYQIILFAILAAFAYVHYGFDDLFISIQSISTFMTCDLKGSAFEALTIYFALRVIGIFIIGIITVLIALLSSNAILYTAISLTLFAANYMLTFINPQSVFSFFKYVNLISILNPVSALSNYINLNIFGFPFSFKIVLMVVIVILLIACLPAGLFVFKTKNLTAKKLKGIAILNKINPFNNTKSLFVFELYKMSFINKAVVLLAAFIVFQVFTAVNTTYYKDPQEYYYANYLQILQGELTQEKVDFIKNEKQKIDEEEKRQNALNEQYNQGLISLSELQQRLDEIGISENRKAAFNKVLVQYEYIQVHPKAQFIYDSGYLKMFHIGAENRLFDSGGFLVLNVLIILCSIWSFPLENQSGMFSILNTIPKGRKETKNNKVKVVLLYDAALFTTMYAAQIFKIVKNYGLSGFSASACSIRELSFLPFLSIGELLVAKLVIAFCFCVAVSFISLFTSNKISTN